MKRPRESDDVVNAVGDERESSRLIENGEERSSFVRSGRRYRVTRKRFAILALSGIIILLDTFGTTFFAFVHDATSAYYDTSSSVTDLISTLSLAGRGFAYVLMAIFSEILDLRPLFLIAPATTFTGSLLVIFGVCSRRNFVILVMGQIISGASAAMGFILADMVCCNWFPPRERGRISAALVIVTRLSQVFSSVISTRSLDTNLHRQNPNNSFNTTLSGADTAEEFKVAYSIVFVAVAAMAFSSFAFSHLFVRNHPPKIGREYGKYRDVGDWTLSHGLRSTWALLKRRSLLLLLLTMVLASSLRPLVDILLSSIILTTFLDASDRFSGILFCLGLSAGAIGSLFGGSVLDRFNLPRCTYAGSILTAVAGCGAFSLALHFHAFSLLYLGYIIFCFFRDILLVSAILVTFTMTEGAPPSSMIRLYALVGGLELSLTPAFTFIVRKTMEVFQPSVAVLVPIPFLCLGGIIWVWKYDILDKSLFCDFQ